MHEMSPVDILIVGAGAIGQVYGYYLQKAGCRVSFLINKTIPTTPFNLYSFSTKQPLSYTPDAVLKIDELGNGYDYIISCVSGPALHNGTWIDTVLSKCSTQKTKKTPLIFVASVGRTADYQNLLRKFKPHKDVMAKSGRHFVFANGLISLISYNAPIPDQKFDPLPIDSPENTIAFLSPGPEGLNHMGLKCEKNNPDDLIGFNSVRKLGNLFKSGGLACNVTCSYTEKEGQLDGFFMAKVFECILLPFLIAAETKEIQWNWARTKRNDGNVGKIIGIASGELFAKQSKTSTWFLERLFFKFMSAFYGLWVLSFVMWIAEKVFPFDVEGYLKYHFTKVSTQIQNQAYGILQEDGNSNELKNFRELANKSPVYKSFTENKK